MNRIFRKHLLSSIVISAFLLITIARAFSAEARHFDHTAMSPDGKHVAWVGPARDGADKSTLGDGLYVQDLDSPSASPVRLSKGELANVNIGDIAWSPDSRSIA